MGGGHGGFEQYQKALSGIGNWKINENRTTLFPIKDD